MTLTKEDINKIVIESSKTLARYIKSATRNGGEVSAEVIADILSAGVDGWCEGHKKKVGDEWYKENHVIKTGDKVSKHEHTNK